MNVVVLLLVLAIAADGLQEGEDCTKDGVAGVCTNIEACSAALQDIQNRKIPQICEFESEDPVVCCVPPAPRAGARRLRVKEEARTLLPRLQATSGRGELQGEDRPPNSTVE